MEMIYVYGFLPGSQALKLRHALPESQMASLRIRHPRQQNGAAPKRHRRPSPRAHCVPGRLTVCGDAERFNGKGCE